MMRRIADERNLLFDIRAPNAESRRAIAALEKGKGKAFAGADAPLKDFSHSHANTDSLRRA